MVRDYGETVSASYKVYQPQEPYEGRSQGILTGDSYLRNQHTGRAICAGTETLVLLDGAYSVLASTFDKRL